MTRIQCAAGVAGLGHFPTKGVAPRVLARMPATPPLPVVLRLRRLVASIAPVRRHTRMYQRRRSRATCAYTSTPVFWLRTVLHTLRHHTLCIAGRMVVRSQMPPLSPPEGYTALVRQLEEVQSARATSLQGAYPDFYRQTGFLCAFNIDQLAVLGQQCRSPLEDKSAEETLLRNATLFIENCHKIISTLARPVDLRLVEVERTNQRSGKLRLREGNYFAHSSAETRRSWAVTLARVLRFFLRAGEARPLCGSNMYLDHAELSSLASAAVREEAAQDIISRTLVTAFFEVDRDALARSCLLPALFCALAVKTVPTTEAPLALRGVVSLARELTCVLNVVKQAGLTTYLLVCRAGALHQLPSWFCATELMRRPVINALIADISGSMLDWSD